jgi:hypothetical protein
LPPHSQHVVKIDKEWWLLCAIGLLLLLTILLVVWPGADADWGGRAKGVLTHQLGSLYLR